MPRRPNLGWFSNSLVSSASALYKKRFFFPKPDNLRAERERERAYRLAAIVRAFAVMYCERVLNISRHFGVVRTPDEGAREKERGGTEGEKERQRERERERGEERTSIQTRLSFQKLKKIHTWVSR